MKITNLLQTRLVEAGSRSSEMQTKNFLLGFVKHTLIWHNAQGRGAEKQRRRERRSDIRDFFIFLNLARARARARVDRRTKRLGALGSPLRGLKGEGTLAFAAACFWSASFFLLFACKVRGRSFKTTSCLRCELQGSATSRHFKSGNLRVRSPQPYGSRKLQIGQIRPKSKEETRTRNFLNISPAYDQSQKWGE